jgi:hypothetical protein
MPTEYWKKYGRVAVTRNAKGQFVRWRPAPKPRTSRALFGFGFYGKQVSVYGLIALMVSEKDTIFTEAEETYKGQLSLLTG